MVFAAVVQEIWLFDFSTSIFFALQILDSCIVCEYVFFVDDFFLEIFFFFHYTTKR